MTRLAIVFVMGAAVAAAQTPAAHEHPAPAPTPADPHAGHAMPEDPHAAHKALAAPPPDGLVWTLDDIEDVARAKNPTLRQAELEIAAAAGMRRQAGRYPNPRIGGVGEHLNQAPGFGGGELGVFVTQRVVTGGKLQAAREVADRRRDQAEFLMEARRLAVTTAIRASFYEALAAQQLVDVQRDLARLAAEAVTISSALFNAGQADRPDILQAEIEAQAAEMALVEAEYSAQAAWRRLAAEAGDPGLAPRRLVADFEEVPRVDADGALARLVAESPELHFARVSADRAGATLREVKASVVPDLHFHFGFRHNNFIAADGNPAGRAGFFQIGADIPLFDRKRGERQAARARIETARADAERVRLSLEARLAHVYADYSSAAALADRYRTAMLPKAEEAYRMYLQNFRAMSAAYPQALIAQRTLFQLRRDYVRTLERTWTSAILIDGLLLEGALDAPDRLY